MKRLMKTPIGKATIYGYLPRIFTFLLTSISFPLVIKRLGAGEYGIFAVLTAFGGFCQIFGDLGITSAVTKAMAETRFYGIEVIKKVIKKWIKTQIFTSAFGFIITCISGVFFIFFMKKINISLYSIFVIAFMGIFAIYSTFLRSILRSLFYFEKLAIMDTTESVLRSLSWLVVATMFPNVKALLIAEMFCLFTSTVIGILLLFLALKKYKCEKEEILIDNNQLLNKHFSYSGILKESVGFLQVKIVSMGFNQLPILIIGKYGKVEYSGLLSALFRVSELLNAPITIFGQIVGVKSVEIRMKGAFAIKKFWERMLRLCSLWTPIVVSFFASSSLIATILMPNVKNVDISFKIFTLFLIVNVFGGIFSPPVDYLGKAKDRAKLMIPIVIVENILIFLGVIFGGIVHVLIIMILCYALLVSVYIYLAGNILKIESFFYIPKDIKILISFTLIGLMCSWGINIFLNLDKFLNIYMQLILNTIIILIFSLVAVIFVPTVREKFSISNLLAFED